MTTIGRASAILIAAGIIAVSLTQSCGRRSAAGFRLPEGDVAKGREAFAALKCNFCHQVEGVDFDPPSIDPPVPKLGRARPVVHTDGELVTSIINPSHRIATPIGNEVSTRNGKTSRMPDFSDQMTVRQLSDIVAFLHSVQKIETAEM